MSVCVNSEQFVFFINKLKCCVDVGSDEADRHAALRYIYLCNLPTASSYLSLTGQTVNSYCCV